MKKAKRMLIAFVALVAAFAHGDVWEDCVALYMGGTDTDNDGVFENGELTDIRHAADPDSPTHGGTLAKNTTVISNQIGRSGTSIGANIREAQYAHGKPDFIAKLQIALKEANETGYWLELLYKTGYIGDQTYKTLDSACASIRVMLISSINTTKQNSDKEQ